MSHTYVSCDCHCVFGTKGRAAVLNPEMRERLFRCMAGVARKYGIGLIAAGGVANHIHLLISLPATMSIASVMKLIKGSSARWFHQTYPEAADFAWQEGYGAFSVSRSQRPKIIRYIADQEAYHSHVSFEEEFAAFLRKHGSFALSSVSDDKDLRPVRD